MAKYDEQTRALYAWEERWRPWNWKDFDTLYYPRAICRQMCRHYRVPVPVVTWGPKLGYPDYDPETHIIRIVATTNNASHILHETAHAIHDWLLGTDGPPHSPEFVGIYLWCITKYRLAPLSAVLASLNETSVQYVHPNLISPKMLYQRYRARIREAAEQRD